MSLGAAGVSPDEGAAAVCGGRGGGGAKSLQGMSPAKAEPEIMQVKAIVITKRFMIFLLRSLSMQEIFYQRIEHHSQYSLQARL
jgi:hypothetical protein